MEPNINNQAADVTLPSDFIPSDAGDDVKAKFAELDPVVVKAIVDYNKGLVTKRDQLISKVSQTQGIIDSLGDIDQVKTKLQTYDQFMAEKADLEKKAASTNKSVEDVRTEMQQMIADRDAKLEQIRTHQITNQKKTQLFHAMKEADVEDPDLLMPHIENRVKVSMNDDGSFVTEVYKADGNPLINDKGDKGSLKDLMAEIRQNAKYAPFIKAKNLSGTGARTGAGQGNAGMENPFLKTSSNYGVGNQTKLYNTDRVLAIQLAQAAGRDITGW